MRIVAVFLALPLSLLSLTLQFCDILKRVNVEWIPYFAPLNLSLAVACQDLITLEQCGAVCKTAAMPLQVQREIGRGRLNRAAAIAPGALFRQPRTIVSEIHDRIGEILYSFLEFSQALIHPADSPGRDWFPCNHQRPTPGVGFRRSINSLVKVSLNGLSCS